MSNQKMSNERTKQRRKKRHAQKIQQARQKYQKWWDSIDIETVQGQSILHLENITESKWSWFPFHVTLPYC